MTLRECIEQVRRYGDSQFRYTGPRKLHLPEPGTPFRWDWKKATLLRRDPAVWHPAVITVRSVNYSA